MDESTKCSVMSDIDNMIDRFHADFGRAPKGLVMGASVAEHVWEHLREMNHKPNNSEGFFYRGVPIRIVTWEDCCFIELEVGQILRFRQLRDANNKAAFESDPNQH